MGFLITAVGTFMDFTPKYYSCANDEVLFLEGRRESVNVMVDGMRERLETSLSKGVSERIKIITLREMVEREDFRAKVRYLFPYLPNDFEIESSDALSARFWEDLGLDGEMPARGAFLWFGEEPMQAYFPVRSSWDALLIGLEVYGKRIADITNGIRDCIFSSIDEFACATPEDTADRQFDDDVEQVMDEIRAKVAQLRSYGVDEVVIRSLFKQPLKLSRLVVTADYRIMLPDYDMEITMEPLPKALYILFLRHPEGLVFKHLYKYRSELMRIYRSITRRENPDSVIASIDRLLDSTDNSINEKCSRIKAAFISRFDEEIAGNYYITSLDKYTTDVVPNHYYDCLFYKGITLDRNLVSLDFVL